MSDSNKHHVVGVEFLKQNGVDVDALIKELTINASVEFVAYYYFTNLRSFCTGMEGEGIKGVIEDARLEDLSHFEIEMLRMQGLKVCDECQGMYGLYEARCPHCDAPNKSHYPAKV